MHFLQLPSASPARRHSPSRSPPPHLPPPSPPRSPTRPRPSPPNPPVRHSHCRSGPSAERSHEPPAYLRIHDPGCRTGAAPAGLPPLLLVGVVWDDADTELHGTVQVRTRATDTTRWSGWQALETHNTDHAADAGSVERLSGRVRGSTVPLWVGDSDGVEVRVRSENAGPRSGAADTAPLPAGLRVELVDPGDDPVLPRAEDTPATGTPSSVTPSPGVATPATAPKPGALPEAAGLGMAAAESSAVNADLAPLGAAEITALSKAESEEQAVVEYGAKPFVGPRPRIVTRKGWGADESLRERAFAYTSTVKAAFIHHSATGNNYTCSQAPSVLRSIYRYHVKSSGWRDIGYNFAVDKCGNIYEGRAGGVTKAVLGAHTLGFNTNSMGIAVLGTYSSKNPPAAAVTAIAKLTAWKLGLFGRNPKGKVTLVSGGSGKYKKGAKAKLNVISGHRDGFATECPGSRLYKKLGTARTSSAKLQGR